MLFPRHNDSPIFFQEEDGNDDGNGIQEEDNSVIYNESNEEENKREGDDRRDDVEDISNSRYNTHHHDFHSIIDDEEDDAYYHEEQHQLDHDEYENFDDADDMRHHHHVISTTTATDEAFFNRYEAMVSQQDAEEKASVGHLRPLFDHLVLSFGDDDKNKKVADASSNEDDEGEDRMIIPALTRSGSSAFEQEQEENENAKDEFLSTESKVLSLNAISRASSHYSTKRTSSSLRTNAMDDIITADRQLIFLLNTLSNDASQNQSTPTLLSLSFPEFVHAYRTVIIGMQALQMLPHNTDRRDLEDTPVKYTAEDRAKTRNRTLEMIRLFSRSSFFQQQKQKSVRIANQPYDHINQREIKRTVQDFDSVKKTNDTNYGRKISKLQRLFYFCLILVGAGMSWVRTTETKKMRESMTKMIARTRELRVIPEEFFSTFDREGETDVPILNSFVVDDDSSSASECVEKNTIELLKQTPEDDFATNKRGQQQEIPQYEIPLKGVTNDFPVSPSIERPSIVKRISSFFSGKQQTQEGRQRRRHRADGNKRSNHKNVDDHTSSSTIGAATAGRLFGSSSDKGEKTYSTLTREKETLENGKK